MPFLGDVDAFALLLLALALSIKAVQARVAALALDNLLGLYTKSCRHNDRKRLKRAEEAAEALPYLPNLLPITCAMSMLILEILEMMMPK